MASGTISLGTSGAMTGQIVWSSYSNGTAANSSNVTATIQVRRTNSYTTTGTFTGSLNIGGVNKSFSHYGNVSNSWVTVLSFTQTISHNANGSGSCYIGGTIYGPSGTSLAGLSVSNSQTVTLDTIPRQASLTSAPNFNDEQNPTITYSNPAGNSVTSLQTCISWTGNADIEYRDISKTGTSYTFNFTNAEREKLRKAATGNTLAVKFYVKTVISGVTYYSTLNKTLTIINASPTLYPIIEDTNSVTVALTGKASKIVKYFSSPAVATGATSYKHATITNNAITNGNKKTDKASDTFYNVENALFAFWAKDSRGNEIYQEINKVNEGNWIDYVKITCDASNNNPTTDGKMTLNINGNYWNGNFGAVANELTLQYRMTIAGQPFGDWVTVGAELDGNTYNAAVQIEGLDYQTTYAFEVRALDKLETTPVKYFEVQTTPVFDWGKNDFWFNVDAHGWFSSDVKDLPDGSGDGLYWQELKAGTYWYDANRFEVGEMPNPWGFVVKIGYTNADYTILFFTQAEGAIFRRSGNLHNDSGWTSIDSGTVLYENANGTNATTIPMSETLANYKSVEVVYGNGSIRKSVKIPKGSAVELFLSRAGYFDNSYYGVRQNTTTLTFNNTNAIKQIGYTFSYKVDGTMVFSDASNEIYIYKIVGYR